MPVVTAHYIYIYISSQNKNERKIGHLVIKEDRRELFLIYVCLSYDKHGLHIICLLSRERHYQWCR